MTQPASANGAPSLQKDAERSSVMRRSRIAPRRTASPAWELPLPDQPQIRRGAHDLPGRGGRQAAAVAAVLDDDGDGDPPALASVGGEADEPGVGGSALDFGGAGLAGDGGKDPGEEAGRGPLGHHAAPGAGEAG